MDELRVMAIVAEPPEVAPGVATTVTVHIADPGDQAPEVMVWGEDTVVGVPVAGTFQTTLSAESGYAPVWALACAPGLCPVMAEPDPDLSDPTAIVADYPMEGVSLALGGFLVSETPVGLKNPVVLPAFESVVVGAGDSIDLSFLVEDGETAYGYAFAGGFDATEYPVAEGNVKLTWYAPEEAGEVELIVVVNGDGTAVWRGVGVVTGG